MGALVPASARAQTATATSTATATATATPTPRPTATATATSTSTPGGIVHEQTVSGAATAPTLSLTSPSLTAAAGHLYLAAVSVRTNTSVVTGVTGLGLTWSRVGQQCSSAGQARVEVWQALGTPTGNGAVTATFAVTANRSVIAVSRYSGVDAASPIGSVVAANSLASGACTGGGVTSSYSVTLPTATLGAFAYGIASTSYLSHTPALGLTERAEPHYGTGTAGAGMAVVDRVATSPTTVLGGSLFSGTTSTAAEIAVIAAEIRPASAPTPTPTAAPTPTNTPTATATSTPTFTPTATATATSTPTSTATSTATATSTPTFTPTATATFTPTATATSTPTATPTAAPTATSTATSTPTSRATSTATATSTPTASAGGIVHEQTVTGLVNASTSSVASASITGVSGHLYLAVVSLRTNTSTVSAVNGLGLTWTRVAQQCSHLGAARVEMWRALGAATTGTVTATLTPAATKVVMSVSRYSGVDATSPIGAVLARNALGVNGACTAAAPTPTAASSYSASLTTTVDGALVVGATTISNAVHTPGSGLTERAEVHAGTGTAGAGVAVEDRLVPSPSAAVVNGTLNVAAEIAIIAAEIRPFAPTPSPSPTATSTPTATATSTATATATSTSTPTATATSTPTSSPTSSPTARATATITARATAPPAPTSGTVTGIVLSDVTGLPLPGASVAIGSSPAAMTDTRGRYVLAASGTSPVLLVTKPGMTSVERTVSFAAGANTVPLDARLTTLGTAQPITATGATLQAGAITVTVPAGAVGAPTSGQLTPLSAQGLPGLLPLGWSSLAAFDLRAPGVAMPVNAGVSGLPASSVSSFAFYDRLVHAWTLVTSALSAGPTGVATTSLPTEGAYAVVVPDSPGLVPAAGAPLAAAEMVAVPSDATVTSDVNPPTLPASGGTAQVTLNVQSATALPSGTVIGATAVESFTLASGAKGAEEQRRFDVLVHRKADGSLSGTIPVTPARTFLDADLSSGEVSLDILAGREAVRGRVATGDTEVIEDQGTSLTLSAGALASGTSITLEQASAFSAFLPSSADLSPIAEFTADFSGQTLVTAAQLSVLAGGLSPTDTFLVARVERYEEIPYLAVVGRAQISGGNVVSVPTSGLPGIVVGGRYVVYRSASPVGFVSGTTTSSAGGVQSLVQGSNMPFIGLAQPNGSYILASLAGSVNVTARVPGTPLAGSGSVTVVANQTAALSIALVGQATLATVTPADGAVAVSVSTQVTITTPKAINAATAIAANVQLKQGTTVVPAHLQLSTTRKSLALIPDAQLAFATTYTLHTANLTDANGAAIVVPATTFTTKADVPPVYNTSALTFSLPDVNGLVTMSAPNGTFPPGTTILVVNGGNGAVISATVGNQGQVAPLVFPASIGDELVITVTDPLGNATTFKRTELVGADGTTGVGAPGGVVKGPGGLELRIPNDALDEAVTIRMVPFTPPTGEPLPPLLSSSPAGSTMQFAGGVQITASEAIEFRHESKLAFPVPGLPAGAPGGFTPRDAFYHVVMRITGANGQLTGYRVIDQAFIEGEGANQRVVTAAPFDGVMDLGTTSHFLLVSTINAILPGKPIGMTVTGVVLEPFFEVVPGQPPSAAPSYRPVQGAIVRVANQAGQILHPYPDLFAVTNKDGRFISWESGGTLAQYTVVAKDAGTPPREGTATLYQANFEDTRSLWPLSNYRAILTGNVTLPMKPLPVAPPEVEIHVFKANSNGTRGPKAAGVVAANTPLIVGLRLKRDDLGLPIGTLKSLTATVQQISDVLTIAADSTPVSSPDHMDGLAYYTPTSVGAVRLSATVQAAFASPVTAHVAFSVTAAAGGGTNLPLVGSSRVDLQACKLEYSIVSPK